MLLAAADQARNTPGWFLATMWGLALVCLGGAGWALTAAWLRRGEADAAQADLRTPAEQGRRAQSSCLAVFAVPVLLLGLFFLTWAIGIS